MTEVLIAAGYTVIPADRDLEDPHLRVLGRRPTGPSWREWVDEGAELMEATCQSPSCSGWYRAMAQGA